MSVILVLRQFCTKLSEILVLLVNNTHEKHLPKKLQVQSDALTHVI